MSQSEVKKNTTGRLSECEPRHSGGQIGEDIAHRVIEPANATLLAFDVLTQGAECPKRLTAARVGSRATIDLVIMRRACKVLVQHGEGCVHLVAKEALVCRPVPGPLRRPGRYRSLQCAIPIGTLNEPRRIRDDIVRVVTRDKAIDLRASEARRARARLEVQRERGNGDELSVAARVDAGNVGLLMDGGPLVSAQVAFALVDALAFDAIPVLLASVFVEPVIVLEEHIAGGAPIVTALEMRVQITLRRVMFIAALAIVMACALHIVLNESVFRDKIPVAAIAKMVHARILFVLLQRALAAEPTLASFAVSHQVCIRRL